MGEVNTRGGGGGGGRAVGRNYFLLKFAVNLKLL